MWRISRNGPLVINFNYTTKNLHSYTAEVALKTGVTFLFFEPHTQIFALCVEPGGNHNFTYTIYKAYTAPGQEKSPPTWVGVLSPNIEISRI